MTKKTKITTRQRRFMCVYASQEYIYGPDNADNLRRAAEIAGVDFDYATTVASMPWFRDKVDMVVRQLRRRRPDPATAEVPKEKQIAPDAAIVSVEPEVTHLQRIHADHLTQQQRMIAEKIATDIEELRYFWADIAVDPQFNIRDRLRATELLARTLSGDMMPSGAAANGRVIFHFDMGDKNDNTRTRKIIR